MGGRRWDKTSCSHQKGKSIWLPSFKLNEVIIWDYIKKMGI